MKFFYIFLLFCCPIWGSEVLKNPIHNFTIEYPSDWRYENKSNLLNKLVNEAIKYADLPQKMSEDVGMSFAVISPKTVALFNANINLVVENLSSTNVSSLSDYREATLNGMKKFLPKYNLLSERMESNLFIHSYLFQNPPQYGGHKLKGIQYIFYNAQKKIGYIFTGTCIPHSEEAQLLKALNTIKFTNG
jgi:hypothetical protein